MASNQGLGPNFFSPDPDPAQPKNGSGSDLIRYEKKYLTVIQEFFTVLTGRIRIRQAKIKGSRSGSSLLLLT